ncbi:MAG: Kazal-type serine protease inhibitor domain-containing protein [bacterium]
MPWYKVFGGLVGILIIMTSCEAIVRDDDSVTVPVEKVEVPAEKSGSSSDTKMCGGIAGLPCGSDREYCAMEIGQCGMADAAGTCQIKPEICTMEHMPVCGCNGKTYSNKCIAAGAGVSVSHLGACD